ncbi:sensor histidine kinase [Hyalangium rubrum]|uniref:histidine kinase n=1 Tax=Hyalangium rubrum TaxID=3103134 RepID=A0ABU5HBG9_9BACT|nr:HAMP domain-containing sensor histidine kinase [Hyalangium sp. s54d21]MDY7230823.1 HAMP domain-containing sensor histidine kinase [Hyalangium sp. s54d21]
MLRWLLPTLVTLGCGLLAIGWGLVSLQRIFAQETEDARAQLFARRDELERYAIEAVRQKLTQKLAESAPSIKRAAEDPLAQADGLYLGFREYQFLPRLSRPRPGAQTPAQRIHEELALLLQAASAPEPWQERMNLLRAIEAALARKEPERAEEYLEALLRYRTEHPLHASREIPFTVFVAERLQRGPDTPELVRRLITGELADEFGGIAQGAGLQRDLLRECYRFTQPDFDFLNERILRLSWQMGEPTEDFEARVQELGAGALVIPAKLSGPTLIGERWYLEPDGEVVRGIAVQLEDLLPVVSREMRERALFDAEDEVRLGDLDPVQPLSSLKLAVVMPRWAATEKDITQRYGLKTVLVAICGALAVAIVVLAGLAQHRKYRFLELKSDFVATVSHELRTPLASIRLLAETLERKARNTPEVRDYPARIIQATDGLHFLVENILSFNRIDKGRWAPQFAQVRLEELVGTLRSDLAGATSVPVQLTSDVGEVELTADPSLLRLLFSNLGRNACAYNHRAPVEISLHAHAVPGKGCTVLFGDNGIGIPEREWENVFQDFYRLKHPGPEVHGSGLGLALCRRIMHVHGGTLRIASSSPQGTTFALIFPEPRR